MSHVIIATNNDDWCGLYVDGVLRHQGHEVSTEVWVALITDLPRELESAKELEVDPDWLCRVGHLPTLLDHVRRLGDGEDS